MDFLRPTAGAAVLGLLGLGVVAAIHGGGPAPVAQSPALANLVSAPDPRPMTRPTPAGSVAAPVSAARETRPRPDHHEAAPSWAPSGRLASTHRRANDEARAGSRPAQLAEESRAERSSGGAIDERERVGRQMMNRMCGRGWIPSAYCGRPDSSAASQGADEDTARDY